jgi:hypothetical protein
MLKITMNVVYLLMHMLSSLIASTSEEDEIILAYVICIGIGSMIVLGLNYILFGSITVWHRTESNK